MSDYKKKLIEVALPLEAINKAAARDSSTLDGHSWNIHYWWARRKLPVCRAVIFAQLVDDPSSCPDRFPTETDQAIERQRLLDIIERLVVWENVNDQSLMDEATREIMRSTNGRPPIIYDPFAGGGSIPLEAQRLGLQTRASDLNPVAVLINKALIEVPPKWRKMPPVFPGAAQQQIEWPKASGLAEDVRLYAQWMLEEATARIGDLYPKFRSDAGEDCNVVAWLWARTITCPNPACGTRMPLVRSWWLSKKMGNVAYVKPTVLRDAGGVPVVQYSVGHDPEGAPTPESDGTVNRAGAICVACKSALPLKQVRSMAQAGDFGQELMALIAECDGSRIYCAPNSKHSDAALVAPPVDLPEGEIGYYPGRSNTLVYGLTHFSDLFTPRQLTALSTFSELVVEARTKILEDARASGFSSDGIRLEADGSGADAYADSVAIYLAAVVDRAADNWSSLSTWNAGNTQMRNVFARQALPMVWDFAEANPFGHTSVSWRMLSGRLPNAISRLGNGLPGVATQASAQTADYSDSLVCTDPPYYDNVGYSILSDFYYGWLRKSLSTVLPNLFGTLQTPKSEELVADPYRHGSKAKASDFFEVGFVEVFTRIRETTPESFPVTLFYAFKQSETSDAGTSSTGWQTLLTGMLKAGWEITGTWPVRTERANRMLAVDSNALASSIVLVMRPRPDFAEAINRRAFVAALRTELPSALRRLEEGSIAPVDLAQAAIGPGMAVFSRYSRVVEADGSEMTVRTALALINQVLDEVLNEQEGDFDSETRFCIRWFSEFEWNEAPFGRADDLSKSTNTSVTALERGGVFRAAAGKARLCSPKEMSADWDPALDKDVSVWEVAVRVANALQTSGSERASEWMAAASNKVDMDAVKELSYLLYSICERKGWTESALLFNGLGTSWSDLSAAARAPRPVVVEQGTFDLDSEDEGE